MSAQIVQFALGVTALEQAQRIGAAGHAFGDALGEVAVKLEKATATVVANEGGLALAAATEEYDAAQSMLAEQLRIASAQLREEADALAKTNQRRKKSAADTDA